jgi:hypothetical protein
MRARGLPQAPSLQRLPTPTEADIKAWEAREQRREGRRRGQQPSGAGAEPPAPRALAGGPLAAGPLLEGSAPGCGSTRSTESFGSRAGDGAASAAGLGSPAGARGNTPQAQARALRRPPFVPRLDLAALITQAASRFGCAAGGRAIGNSSGGGGAELPVREQVPLARPERDTLEALLSGRPLCSSRTPSPPGRPVAMSSAGDVPAKARRSSGGTNRAGSCSARDASLAGPSSRSGETATLTHRLTQQRGPESSCGVSLLAGVSGTGVLHSGSSGGARHASGGTGLGCKDHVGSPHGPPALSVAQSCPAAQRFGSGAGGWGSSRLGSSSGGVQCSHERQLTPPSSGPLHTALQLLGPGAGSSSGGGGRGGGAGGGDDGAALQRVVAALEGGAACCAAGTAAGPPRRPNPRRACGHALSSGGATAGDGGPVALQAYRLTPRRPGSGRAAV